MKVAIIGGGPLGMEMSLDLLSLGAEVSLFSLCLGGKIKEMVGHYPNHSMDVSWQNLLSEHGQNLLNSIDKKFLEKIDRGKIPTLFEYWNSYLAPLMASPCIKNILKKGEVKRVHKRFLGIEEDVPHKSRLHDLFRVVYLMTPDKESFNEHQLGSLGEDVLTSLHEPLENFEDFDIVIDATGVLGNPSPMGASSSFALNEKMDSLKDRVFYGVDIFSNLSLICDKAKKIVLVGSGQTAARALIELKEVIENKKCECSVVTTAPIPFQEFLEEEGSPSLKKSFEEFRQRQNSAFEKERDTFEKKIREWRELEDYMKAKISKPQEPSRNPAFLGGFNVVSVDKLIDREGLFVTCEDVDFRGGKNQIKTIPCDFILVASGYTCHDSLYSGLRTAFENSRKVTLSEDGTHPEPGFFTLGPIKKGDRERYSLQEGLTQIKRIREKMLEFFTKVGE